LIAHGLNLENKVGILADLLRAYGSTRGIAHQTNTGLIG
jgi:hypothetical protein